ncbi:MAG: N-6 DNA methylase, partial [Bacteroidia bacterium]|nr:N-6 DNA methylase [Bacteroidia bacterium]
MKIERQLQGTLNTIFTEEIKSRRLENRIFPYSVEEEGRADITLKNSKGKTIFFIELKDPRAIDGKSIFDSNILQRELERAQRLEIDYFGVCNFTAAALLDTKKMYEKNAVSECFFSVAEIVRLSVNYVPTNEIQRKLRIIANFYLDRAVEIIERKAIKFTPIDELFIFKIRNLIEIYGYGITEKVWEKYKSNKEFKKEISDYARKQHWNIPAIYEEIENITYISLLMLISKLIFYKTYFDNNIWKGLSPIIIDDNIDSAKKLEETLWDYFHEFQEITRNFELLIGIRDHIIFRIPFVSDHSIELVRSVLNAGAHYNFSSAKYDVIGRIFEELIREDERHKLGQYFTPPNVVDLINVFAIRTGREKIFDPSCGSGTFLVRSYERKKKLNPKMHSALLKEIYGNDVSDYPAYLSMLNLAVRNISKHSYPKIIHSDFFSIVPSVKLEVLNQRGEKERRCLPQFDAIIGNPPSTRQEEIGSLQGLVNKETITDLQQWMLRHFEIVAIMDSEVERFFPAASVNTTIVILKRCNGRDEDIRNSNLVRFIFFKEKLVEILKEYKNADTLITVFEKTNNSVENDFFKITCVEQKELLNESKWGIFLKAPEVYFNILKKGKGKFKTLGTNEGIANIFYGLKTGCNEFFYLKDITKTSKNNIVFSIVNNIEKFRSIDEIRKNNLRIVQNGLNEIWLIESDFVKPAIKTTKEINSYLIDKLSEEN